jgi:hypothetical protein
MRYARRRPILLVGGAIAVVAVLVATIGLSGVLTGKSPAASGAQSQGASPQPSYPAAVVPPLVEITKVDSTKVAADGDKVTDANGVSVTLAESATAGSSAIQLAAGDLPASFDASMVSDDGWKRISKVYSLELDKDSDVIGNVPLSFPSSSPDDRVAVLMDGRHLLVLGVTPANGQLTVQASTESATSAAYEGEGDHYFVVTKATSAAAQGGLARMAVAAGEYQQEAGGGNADSSASATCDYGRFPPTMTCWNAAKSISFQAHSELDSDWQAKVGVFFDRVATIMKKYGSLGFTYTDPTPSDPIKIIADPSIDPSSGNGNPNYDPGLLPWCSKIYVGFHTVANIGEAGEQQLIAHELFHWVQHHKYPMRLDGNSPTKYWHTETQAEAASFLVDQTYQPARLLKVASQLQKEGTQGVLGWQKSVGAWDHGLIHTLDDPSRYVQGQVVSLGICDGPTCIESQKDLVGEVNGGYRRFSAANYHLGLDNTIRYLLGTAPAGVKVDMTAQILKTGRGIGDYIHLSQKPGGNWDYAVIDAVTNLTKTPASGEIAIHASIASDGLYPLRVSNGPDIPIDDNCLPGHVKFSGKELEPNAPYFVHLEAGVELYWRIGDGSIQHSDGSKPTDIGPITSQASVAVQAADHSWSAKPGIPSVRIVAVNQTKDAVTLSGVVTPQAPRMGASPERVAKAALSAPVQLRLDMTQVALNFTGATAEWDFGDGSANQPTTITPDAKLQANVQVTHTFTGASTNVRVTFRDKAGKPLTWDPVNIPVGDAAAMPGNFNSLHVYMPISLSNYLLRSDVDVKIRMTGERTFEMTSSDPPDYYSLKGEISADGKSLSMTVLFGDPSKYSCPHQMILRNLPYLGTDAPAIQDVKYGVMGYSKVLAYMEYDFSYLDAKNVEICQTADDWNHYEDNTGARVIITLNY